MRWWRLWVVYCDLGVDVFVIVIGFGVGVVIVEGIDEINVYLKGLWII